MDFYFLLYYPFTFLPFYPFTHKKWREVVGTTPVILLFTLKFSRSYLFCPSFFTKK